MVKKKRSSKIRPPSFKKRGLDALVGGAPRKKISKKINGKGLTTKQILKLLDARSKRTLEKLILANRRKR